MPTPPAATPAAPSQRGNTLPSSMPQPNSSVASPRANPPTRCASSANGRSMSNRNTARVAVIPASAAAKIRASAHPAPAEQQRRESEGESPHPLRIERERPQHVEQEHGPGGGHPRVGGRKAPRQRPPRPAHERDDDHPHGVAERR